jgi:hypothetical protein
MTASIAKRPREGLLAKLVRIGGKPGIPEGLVNLYLGVIADSSDKSVDL